MVDIPPCLGSSQTYCHQEQLRVGGELPCNLWKENKCRPAGSDESLAVHFECPISVLPLKYPTSQEIEIQKQYYGAIGLSYE